MATMRLVPRILNKEQALAALSDFRNRFETGDSDEGQFVITMALEADEPGMYEVAARYRVGNLEGQGGMRIIGSMLEVPGA